MCPSRAARNERLSRGLLVVSRAAVHSNPILLGRLTPRLDSGPGIG